MKYFFYKKFAATFTVKVAHETDVNFTFAITGILRRIY